MTKIKSAAHRVCSVFESPNPSHSVIYIEGEGHNKTTLAPLFNATMKFGNGHQGTENNNTYYSGSSYADYSNTQQKEASIGQWGYGLALTKETAVSQMTDGGLGNSTMSSWIPLHKMNMDPNGSNGTIKRFTNSGGIDRIFWIKNNFPYSRYSVTSWYNTSSAVELHQTAPSTSAVGYGGTTSNSAQNCPATPVWNNDDYTVFITHQSNIGGARGDKPFQGYGRSTYSGHESIDYGQNIRDHYVTQFIGEGSDGNPVFLQNAKDNDYTQYIMRYNVGNNNSTQLHLFNAAPSAAGTSYGGARGTTTIGSGICKWASQTFTDFTSGADAADKGFYLPYFDTNYDYHPHYYQWDVSANTFTRNEDITISGDKSSVHMAFPHNDVGDNAGMRNNCWNDTFVSGGTRYLTVMFISGDTIVADGAENQRTFITYSCAAADPKTLTHHSTASVPETITNQVWLNDAKTIMGVITKQAIYVYTWDNTNGWERTSTIPGKFPAVGRDSTDRIWALEQETSGNFADIHVLSLDVPISVVITPASSSYNYTGTTINTSVGVSAYNISGDRIATDVKLTIDGTSMEFSGGSDSATVTTLTNADVSQNVNILSAGVSDIIANIAL
jgi:hypothetical protein